MIDFMLIFAGFCLLALGGEVLVRGAVATAERFNVSQFMFGSVVIGFGSSLPELVTSLDAALIGSPGIAVGNIVGSNIANILLVLGLAALIGPIALKGENIRSDAALVLLATGSFVAVSLWLSLNTAVGIGLFLALAAYLYLACRREQGALGPVNSDGALASTPRPKMLRSLVMITGGLVLMVGGGHAVVKGGISLANDLGVSDAIIGLTVIAIGTTLPEIVTSVVAALRKQADVAVGNVMGSCLFNILGIGGVIAIAVPTEVPSHIAHFDNPVMLAAAIGLCVLVLTGARITRAHGALLLAGYGTYLFMLWP